MVTVPNEDFALSLLRYSIPSGNTFLEGRLLEILQSYLTKV